MSRPEPYPGDDLEAQDDGAPAEPDLPDEAFTSDAPPPDDGLEP